MLQEQKDKGLRFSQKAIESWMHICRAEMVKNSLGKEFVKRSKFCSQCKKSESLGLSNIKCCRTEKFEES